MMATSTQRDPRSIITPDAFEVADHLMGMPLASPRRRALALAIDGLVIAFITVVTKSFALILGVVAAAFFMRAGFKRTKVRNSVFGRAMRVSVGCLGVLIAAVTASLWFAFGADFGARDRTDATEASSGVVATLGTVFSGLEALGLLEDISAADSIGEAERAGRELVGLARARGLNEETLREALLALPGDDQAWGDGWAPVVDRLLADGVDVELSESELDATEDAEIRVSGMSDEEALTAYAGLLSAPDEDPALEAALEARLGPLVASDSLELLERRSERLTRQLGDTRRALQDAEDELAASSDSGVFGWVRTRLDELGFGFGWAAIYLSVFLSWWNGQTIGKRMMGIRVVRLDGEAITWWTAFERAGGYAAGLATGLLGFAQVWWDANRQAIHDRIVGTVVVREGAERVSDWESAL